MPLYDQRCEDCDNTFEERRGWDAAPSPCPVCGGSAHTIWLQTPSSERAKDPYDLLDGPIADSKQIKSFANDRRRGGKDTT